MGLKHTQFDYYQTKPVTVVYALISNIAINTTLKATAQQK